MNIWVWKIRNYELWIINNPQEPIGTMHQSESTPDPWDIVGNITFLQCYFSTPPPSWPSGNTWLSQSQPLWLQCEPYDLAKLVYIVIDCSEKMLPSVAKSLANIFSAQNQQKQTKHFWWSILNNSKITEIARNADPKTFTSDYICCHNKFWNHKIILKTKFKINVQSAWSERVRFAEVIVHVASSNCNNDTYLRVSTLFREYHWCWYE